MSTDFIFDDLGRFDEIFGDLEFTRIRKDERVLLFVYGTMKDGARNHGRLARAEFIDNAITVHRAFHLHERRTHLGLPAPIAIPGEKKIQGELYRIPSRLLIDLDMYEGHPTVYRRIEVEVMTADDILASLDADCILGQTAWTYLAASYDFNLNRDTEAMMTVTGQVTAWESPR